LLCSNEAVLLVEYPSIPAIYELSTCRLHV
jgi:hypothetical protein